MTYMLCRKHVIDFDNWHKIFRRMPLLTGGLGSISRICGGQRKLQTTSTLSFASKSIERARAFIDAPDAAEAGKASGVVAGEYHFVEDAAGYPT